MHPPKKSSFRLAGIGLTNLDLVCQYVRRATGQDCSRTDALRLIVNWASEVMLEFAPEETPDGPTPIECKFCRLKTGLRWHSDRESLLCTQCDNPSANGKNSQLSSKLEGV